MTAWRKSSFSAASNCCVLVSIDRDAGVVLVASDRTPDVAPHSFTAEEWSAFVAGVKAGEFDWEVPDG